MSSEKLPQYQPAQLEGAPGVVQDAPGVQGAPSVQNAPSVQGAPGVQGFPDGPQDVAHVAQNYRDQCQFFILFSSCATYYARKRLLTICTISYSVRSVCCRKS